MGGESSDVDYEKRKIINESLFIKKLANIFGIPRPRKENVESRLNRLEHKINVLEVAEREAWREIMNLKHGKK